MIYLYISFQVTQSLPVVDDDLRAQLSPIALLSGSKCTNFKNGGYDWMLVNLTDRTALSSLRRRTLIRPGQYFRSETLTVFKKSPRIEELSPISTLLCRQCTN